MIIISINTRKYKNSEQLDLKLNNVISIGDRSSWKSRSFDTSNTKFLVLSFTVLFKLYNFVFFIIQL